MVLIVEDGSIVAGANSYVDATFIRAYADARGFDISAVSDIDLEAFAIMAMDHIEAKSYQGCRVQCDQPLSFPRTGVWVDNCELPSDSIPLNLKNAQCQLVVEIDGGLNLDATVTEPGVKRKKIDVLEKEYFGNSTGAAATGPELTKVDNLLKPLLSAGSGIRTLRI